LSASRRRKIEAVIFDMDGLLIASESVYLKRLKEFVIERTGKEVSEDFEASLVGKSADEEERVICKKFRVKLADGELYREFVSAFKKVKRVPPMPSAKEAVFFFRKKGLKIAIASSSPRWYIEKFAKAAGFGKFDAIACGDEVRKKKPAPDIYLLAAKRLGVKPANCLGVDDSSTGIRAVKNAGMLAVAVPNKYTLRQDFSRTDVLIPSLRELIYLGKGEYLAWET
jgi:HAD superfamily hydrolase (TIGR01509 family)